MMLGVPQDSSCPRDLQTLVIPLPSPTRMFRRATPDDAVRRCSSGVLQSSDCGLGVASRPNSGVTNTNRRGQQGSVAVQALGNHPCHVRLWDL